MELEKKREEKEITQERFFFFWQIHWQAFAHAIILWAKTELVSSSYNLKPVCQPEKQAGFF